MILAALRVVHHLLQHLTIELEGRIGSVQRIELLELKFYRFSRFVAGKLVPTFAVSPAA